MNISRRPTLVPQDRPPATGRVLPRPQQHHAAAPVADFLSAVHTVEWLPKYAPELNDIEPVWRDLKAHHLAHQTFKDIDALDQAIHAAVHARNQQRKPHSLAKQRMSA